MFAVGTVYLGLIGIFAGAVSVIEPLSFLGIATRLDALMVVAISLLLAVTGCLLPAKETRIFPLRSQLDQFLPVYQFNEVHSIRIAAGKEHAYQAIKSVTAGEILFFRTLIWMRRFGRPGPESILNPGNDTPLLDVATQTAFTSLADVPNQEIAVGTFVSTPPGWKRERKGRSTPEDFKTLRSPGFVPAAMNFRIEDDGPNACIVTTETRIYAAGAPSRRRFAAYWRVIYPGSSLIRFMWLRAIKKRATR